ncbi:MAG: family 10 glycosylhydrolase [Deltaproteobacteria bacterium]|nr:family 10 glycosylhydrolase [Deltaproteobacteria bacterium]
MWCFELVVSSQKSVISRQRRWNFRHYCLLATAYWLLATVSIAQDNPSFSTAEEQFQYASILLRQGHYTVTAREYGRVIERFPLSPLIPYAQYMMAEAYYRGGLYQEAFRHYRQFLLNFPTSSRVPDVITRVELCRMRLEEIQLFSPPPLPVVKMPKGKGIRAVQIALFEGKTYDEVDNEIEGLKSAGIDTIIVRVFQNKGDRFYPSVRPQSQIGVYFKTTHVPVVEDILEKVVEMGHRHGLKVFAWMTTRYANYGLEAKDDLRCKAYDFRTKGVVPCQGLDLFNDEAVTHLEGIYKDLSKYPIDGILFQDDLFLRHNEGFGYKAEALFLKGKGIRLDPERFYQGVMERPYGRYHVSHYTPLFWEWSFWKTGRLMYIAKRLKEAVRSVNPDVRFAINLMYETVYNPPMAQAWLSQNLDEAVKEGFDYYAIMAYHQQMQEELGRDLSYVRGLIERMALDTVKRVGDPTRVLMKFQTIDWTTRKNLPDEETVGLLKGIGGIDSNMGLAVVPYRKDFPFYSVAIKEGM